MSVVSLEQKTAWSEAKIINALSRDTFKRKCLLLVDNCKWTGHECDVLGVTTDLRIIDIEVKISRADLKADAKKDKWWHRTGWGAGMVSTHREWPQKVWKHYYALPQNVWREDLAEFLGSPSSGVLTLRESNYGQIFVDLVRRAKPNKLAPRISSESVVDIARLQNLRMWEAYMTRDRAVRDYKDRLAA